MKKYCDLQDKIINCEYYESDQYQTTISIKSIQFLNVKQIYKDQFSYII